jgi:hypothetical protein
MAARISGRWTDLDERVAAASRTGRRWIARRRHLAATCVAVVWRVTRVLLVMSAALLPLAAIVASAVWPGVEHDLQQVNRSLLQVLQLLALLLALWLLMAIVRWLSRSEPGVVTPFRDATGGGLTAVSDLLVGHLDRIATVQNWDIPDTPGERLHVAPILPNPETVDTSLANVGTVNVGGQATLSIGQALITLKRLWPLGGQGVTISGSVQRYRQKTRIVATIQRRQGTETIMVDGPVTNAAEVDQPVPAMVRELAYRIHFALAHKRMQAGTWEQLDRFTEARAAYIRYLGSRQLADCRRALELTERAYKVDCTYVRLFGLFYALGTAFFGGDDHECAMRQFRAAQTIHPRQPQVFVQLARCHFALGRDDQALNVLEGIPAEPPDGHQMVPYMRGLILAATGQHQKAIEELRRVPQRPRSPRSAAWVTIAGLHRQECDWQGCERALQHVAPCDFDGDAYGRACWLSVRSRPMDSKGREMALESLREALRARLIPLSYARRDPDLHHIRENGTFPDLQPLP